MVRGFFIQLDFRRIQKFDMEIRIQNKNKFMDFKDDVGIGGIFLKSIGSLYILVFVEIFDLGFLLVQ